jgi:EAL domain-containing protein (putative c-di-GMP-specific phosphodiesterase class I)
MGSLLSLFHSVAGVGVASNRLLVIDDDPASSAIIGRIARGCGYDTIITTDTDDFRSRVLSWEPAVIVLDLSMPEMDGDQVMAWLAKQGCKAHILIVSGLELDRMQEAGATGRSLGLNMAGVLQKSQDMEKIRDVFREIYDAAGVLSIQDISKALINQEIRLVYQPQIELKNGTVVGFEALARWNHPKRGPVPPATFIPLLEANEIMNDFTSQILGMALDDMHLWNGATGARVSINASTANCGCMGIDEMVRSQCILKGIDIQRITIEITERAAMTEAGEVDACLARLHELGAQVSIDDFGTGYSSLVKLNQLPFSELKIDKSFITGSDSDLQNGILVRAMIDLAHNLNKKVVAEGVESLETLRCLRGWGCDFAQGYFIGRPMPPDEVIPWLRQYTSPFGETELEPPTPLILN